MPAEASPTIGRLAANWSVPATGNVAGDQAETPDYDMADRVAPSDPRPGPSRRPDTLSTHRKALARRAGWGLSALEPRGTAPYVMASPRFSDAVEHIQGGRLELAGLPLARRIRTQRTHLESMLGGSAVLHVVLLVLLPILYARQGRLQPPSDQTSVQMVFGQSGMTGADTPDAGGGGKPAAPLPAPIPAPPVPVTPTAPPPEQQQPAVNPELPPPPPPVPVPDFIPVPPPPPITAPEKPQAHQTQPVRIPLMTMRPQTHAQRSSPFSHPMDLSFSEAPGPQIRRTGRPAGSHAPVDLSLGPLVKNGRLNTPFATVGIKGVSDDYGNEIDAWIRRHLYYPPEAAEHGEDGQTSVHVVLDRTGQVKSVRLVGPSGSYTLDDSTQGMFRGAKLPPVPPDMQGDHFDIDLTVNYILIRP